MTLKHTNFNQNHLIQQKLPEKDWKAVKQPTESKQK